ncbi:MAG: pentapeptide repeat-containing protein, partial [Caulobacter sp.]
MSRLRTALKIDNAVLTPKDFAAMVMRHEAFASGRRGGARAIGRFIEVRGVACIKRMLADADFTGANFENAVLAGSDLSRASFYCANLARTDLRRAILRRADLRGAKLGGAVLASAVLDEADLRAAVLCLVDELTGLRWMGSSVDARGASLNEADMSEAVAHGVDFSNCSLRGASLRSANLKNANFTNANLSGVNLVGARLEGVRMRGAILTGVDVERLYLPPSALEGCVLDPTAEAWIHSPARDGGPADVSGRDLRTAPVFRNRTLPGLAAGDVLAVDMDFSESRLQAACFDGADLRGVNFSGADLRGASFRGANLTHARF